MTTVHCSQRVKKENRNIGNQLKFLGGPHNTQFIINEEKKKTYCKRACKTNCTKDFLTKKNWNILRLFCQK